MKVFAFLKEGVFLVISAINYLVLIRAPLISRKSRYFLFKVIGNSKNCIFSMGSKLNRSLIILHGVDNSIELNDSIIIKTKITIRGNNNQILLKKGVVLRNGIIHIRGNNCTVKIGAGSSFGQVRIVNVGRNNSISIGDNCLFADNIEIWASDTHSIYDIDGKFINPERPVEIGNNVWVGCFVRILKGVKIGDSSIIGMNSVVTKDVMSNTLNAGNPLKCLKRDVTWSIDYPNEN